MPEPLLPLELAWSLHTRVTAVSEKPLSELEARTREAANPTALVDANDPARFQRACMLGLAAVTDLS